MLRSDPWIIMRQILALCMTVLVVYGALFAISVVITPLPSRSAPIDTFRAGSSVLKTPAKMIYYGRSSLSEPVPKVLVFGSSNSQVGFDRIALSEALPVYSVHNLGIGDTNIHELAQIVELATMRIPPNELADSVAVLGIWYGMFVENANRWGTETHPETNIDRERLRYGLWQREKEGLTRRQFAPEPETLAILLHPLFVLETTLRDLTAGLRSLVFVRPPQFDESVRNSKTVSEAEKRRAFAWRREFIGSEELAEEQYIKLGALLEALDQRGIHTILADLPIPEWHAVGLPYDQQHQAFMNVYIEQYKSMERVHYLQLRDLDNESTFYDDAHVRPRNRQPWLERLIDTIPDSVTNE